MGRRVSIPVRVVRSTEDRAEGNVPPGDGPRPTFGDRDGLLPVAPRPQDSEVEGSGWRAPAATAAPVDAVAAPEPQEAEAAPAQDQDWRDRALRAQAEMDNYRKRQQRWAQDQIETERRRLLNAYLQVVDDLERALAAPAVDDVAPDHGEGLRAGADLRRGVELTHRAAMQFLQKEGVEPIKARHQPFDPNWHEAVATTGRNGSGLPSGTVLKVLETGYRLDGRLLRPAKVIVAV
jgi:molecular chaperone GrpE